MGTTGIQKDKYGQEITFYIAHCNDCEQNVRLSSTSTVTPEQIAQLQKRLLCSDCLKTRLAVKK